MMNPSRGGGALGAVVIGRLMRDECEASRSFAVRLMPHSDVPAGRPSRPPAVQLLASMHIGYGA